MSVRGIFCVASLTFVLGAGAARAQPPGPCPAGEMRPLGSATSAYAGLVVRPLRAFRSPGGGAFARFGLRNVNRAPTVLGVLAEQVDGRCRATWLHVELPIRPNGATGWVRADRLRLHRVRTRIVVDLS